jgi:hypothetical protein
MKNTRKSFFTFCTEIVQIKFKKLYLSAKNGSPIILLFVF